MIKFAKEISYAAPFAHHVYVTQYEMHRISANEKFRQSVMSPEFAYTRYRPNFGVTAYLRDSSSPTGVLAGGTAWSLEDGTAILDSVAKPFPLSPTEGLNKSGANA